MVYNINLENRVELNIKEINAITVLASLTQKMIGVIKRKPMDCELIVKGIHNKYLEIEPILKNLDYLEIVRREMNNIEKIYSAFEIDPSFSASDYWCKNNLNKES